MDNPEKLTTYGVQDDDKTKQKDTPLYTNKHK